MLDRYSSLSETLLPSSCEVINSFAGHGDLGECFTVPPSSAFLTQSCQAKAVKLGVMTEAAEWSHAGT